MMLHLYAEFWINSNVFHWEKAYLSVLESETCRSLWFVARAGLYNIKLNKKRLELGHIPLYLATR